MGVLQERWSQAFHTGVQLLKMGKRVHVAHEVSNAAKGPMQRVVQRGMDQGLSLCTLRQRKSFYCGKTSFWDCSCCGFVLNRYQFCTVSFLKKAIFVKSKHFWRNVFFGGSFFFNSNSPNSLCLIFNCCFLFSRFFLFFYIENQLQSSKNQWSWRYLIISF